MTPRNALLFCALLCPAAQGIGHAQFKAMDEPTVKPGAAKPGAATTAAEFPRPKYLGDVATLGHNIQRTMTLLSTSTPGHRNTVRILFYGQSITEQSWWQEVAADLRRRFPNANLQIENRALGGFSSQRLVKTSESDLYSFAPDLVIFHVYGSHTDYADIIRRIRERTTAEVLIQTDHVTKDEDLAEETDPAKIRLEGAMWNSFMNYVHLPGLARQYSTGLVDGRNLWKRYLRETGAHAPQLLRDGVHLNDWGNFVMAELVKAALVRRPETRLDPMNCGTVRTFQVGKEVQIVGSKLSLPFEGNRVDVIFKPDAQAPGASATVRIDGKKPSEIGELYSFGRALSTPGGKWPVVLKLGWQKPPIVEDWTMEVLKDAANDKRFTFSLSGSRTGPDGEGSSDAPFVSRSGRVTIAPADWDVDYSLALPGIKPMPNQLSVKWSVVAHFLDQLSVPAATDASVENFVTLAHGLPAGPHTLELSGPALASIAAIRVYKPPFQATAGQP